MHALGGLVGHLGLQQERDVRNQLVVQQLWHCRIVDRLAGRKWNSENMRCERRTSKREPRAMYSMTMHILGALVDAAMNSTTLGCRNAVITRTCDMLVSTRSNEGAVVVWCGG